MGKTVCHETSRQPLPVAHLCDGMGTTTSKDIHSYGQNAKTFFRLISLTVFSLASSSGLGANLSVGENTAADLHGGTFKIILHGESGVSYYLRTSSELGNEWTLVETDPDPFIGNGNDQDIAVSTDPSSPASFYSMESRFERRARLFIENYKRQLESGGPAILTVDGAQVQSSITIEEDRANDQMVITANGVPNYIPKILGVDVTDGWRFAGDTSISFSSLKLSEENLGSLGNNNPNGITVAEETFRIPLHPVFNNLPNNTSLGTVGVAVNGIPIYDPFENPHQGWAYGRIFSGCCGHPQINGVYHYHKYPTCLQLLTGNNARTEKEKCDELDALLANGGHSPLLGFARDGFAIYGPVGWVDSGRSSKLLQSGYTGNDDPFGNPNYITSSGDLDRCNGLTSPTPEFPEGIYHYVMSIEADTDGSVYRYINPYFGYDVRGVLEKYNLTPPGWGDDTAYLGALQSGFDINGISVSGTDSFDTFYDFISGIRAALNSSGMSEVADEFDTMKIQYPATIRTYRGNAAG